MFDSQDDAFLTSDCSELGIRKGSPPNKALSDALAVTASLHLDRIAVEELQGVIEACPFPIVSITRDHCVRLWNRSAEELFGWSAAHVRGRYLPTVATENRGDFEDNCALVFSGQKVQLQCVPAITRAGKNLLINVFSAPVFTSSGSISGAISIVEDVTEKKRIEQLEARAASELKRAERSRTLLLRRLMNAQEQERRWIAQELHDHTGQSMLAVSLGLKAIESAESPEQMQEAARALREICSDTLKDLSQLARGIHPSVVDDLGLPLAIERYCADFSNSFGTPVEVFASVKGRSQLGPDSAIALYRILQEALTNIRKHALATKVRVDMNETSSHVILAIQDNGRGFTVSGANRSGHLGVTGMRERAAAIGAEFTIRSRKGCGTEITVTVPSRKPQCRTKRSRS